MHTSHGVAGLARRRRELRTKFHHDGRRLRRRLHGPTLLAARPTAEGAWDTKKDCLVIKGVKPGEPADWLRADPKAPMRFVPTAPSNVDFVPYFELDDEQMTVYPCYEI